MAKEVHDQFNFQHIECFLTEVSVVLKGTPKCVVKTSMWAVDSWQAAPSTECLQCRGHRIPQSDEKGGMHQPPCLHCHIGIDAHDNKRQRQSMNWMIYPECSLSTSLLYLFTSNVSSQHSGQPIWVHSCMPKENLSITGHFGKLSAKFSCKLLLLKQSV